LPLPHLGLTKYFSTKTASSPKEFLASLREDSSMVSNSSGLFTILMPYRPQKEFVGDPERRSLTLSFALHDGQGAQREGRKRKKDLSTAAHDGLDEHGISNLVSLSLQLLQTLVLTMIPRNHRHTSIGHNNLRGTKQQAASKCVGKEKEKKKKKTKQKKKQTSWSPCHEWLEQEVQ